MATTTQTASPVNGLDREGLLQTVGLIQADSDLARFQFRLDHQWLGGSRSRSTIRGFFGAGQQREHDSPFVLGADESHVLLGTDSSPSAGELLLHALAACVTGSIVYHATARGVTIEKIESAVEGDADLRGFLGLDPSVRNGFTRIRMHFKIKADVSDAQLQELFELGPKFSPVFDTLTKGVPVTATAERLS
ncbi:MAG: OsmC family protein [Vicinamibacterales bacterium]